MHQSRYQVTGIGLRAPAGIGARLGCHWGMLSLGVSALCQLETEQLVGPAFRVIRTCGLGGNKSFIFVGKCQQLGIQNKKAPSLG